MILIVSELTVFIGTQMFLIKYLHGNPGGWLLDVTTVWS